MKKVFAYLWQRRWCRLLLAGIVVCAVPFLHPFLRQSVFGPTIQDIPWCMWEDAIRRSAHGEPNDQSWIEKAMEMLGFKRDRQFAVDINSASAVPVYMHLADDRDVVVRRQALSRLRDFAGIDQHAPAILPILRAHLEDPDPDCRFSSTAGLWHAEKDATLIPIMRELCDHDELQILAIQILGEMAGSDSNLFESFAKWTEDHDSRIRNPAVIAMRHYGKRGLPILHKSLNHKDDWTKLAAIEAATALKADALSLVPNLIGIRDGTDKNLGRLAATALAEIDPTRFSAPAQLVD